MPQQKLPLPEINLSPPEPGIPYLGFSLSTDVEAARQRFIEKFGQEPQYIGRYKFILWVGPVPEEVNS